jgi:hypothetical protein
MYNIEHRRRGNILFSFNCDLISNKAFIDQNELQFIISLMVWWTLALFAVVHFFNDCRILVDMMSFCGCYLNKLMIVNSYPCFYHQMFGLNSSKHKLMLNSKLGIVIEMLIYINDIMFFVV